MKRILYAILIFGRVAASNDVLCSQKEYPKKEKDGLTLTRNKTSKKYGLNDTQDATTILTQAWKDLKGSEKLSDQEITNKVENLPLNVKVHIASFLLDGEKMKRTKLNNLMYFIPAMSNPWVIIPSSEPRKILNVRLRDGLSTWINEFKRLYTEAGIVSLDPKHIVFFQGLVKSESTSFKALDALIDPFYYTWRFDIPKEKQTANIKKYLLGSTSENADIIYGLIGYSDGTWQWILHPYYMTRLKALSYEQFMFCRELDVAYKINFDKFQRSLVLNDRMKNIFYTLPKFMQYNLAFHYDIDVEENEAIMLRRPGFWGYIKSTLGLS